METWQGLQARLFHLGWLGEELPEFVSRAAAGGAGGGGWLFREVAREARIVAEIADAYLAECEKAGLSGPGGDTPDPPDWRYPDRDCAHSRCHERGRDRTVCGGSGGRDRSPDTGGSAAGGGAA